MITYSTFSSLTPRRLLPVAGIFAIVTGACATTTATRSDPAAGATEVAATTVAAATQNPSVGEIIPGVPNRPDLVTVVPFYTKEDETEREKTKVVIPAEINGHPSIFILDLGSTPTILNRTFLQPSASGEVDTVTDANRLPDSTSRADYLDDEPGVWQKVHVKVKIGTIPINFDDPDLTHAVQEPNPHRYNAILAHLWGNFGWVFSPRLGNIGPSVLEQFETVIDYTHRRVILIKLDSAGHRMVDVPAYASRWTAPLLPVPIFGGKFHGLGINVQSDHTLDTLNATNNTQLVMLDTGAPASGGDIFGYDFLSSFGVFGVNQRTHQFILYR